MFDWWRKKRNITNGKKTVRPAPRAPYWKRINSIRSLGMNLIDRIAIAIDIIQMIDLLSPSIPFFPKTVYTISRTITKRRSFAKRNSSKVFMLRMASLMNRMRMKITSLSPSVSCSRPWMGPAVTEGNSSRKQEVGSRKCVRLFFICG